MHSDRERLPDRAEPRTSMRELNAVIENPDRVERALQVARWILASKPAYLPKHAPAWRDFMNTREYADHRNAVAFVEAQNAVALVTLVETLVVIQNNIASDSPERAAKREVAATHLLAIIGGPWRVGDAALADRGDGVNRPYESWATWARRYTRLPDCYPPKGYQPPKVAPPKDDSDGYHRPPPYRGRR